MVSRLHPLSRLGPMGRQAPRTVGFMDSGLGGLSVLRHAVQMAPHLRYLYYADSSYCPYGPKEAEQVRTRVAHMAGILLEAGAGVLVLACNTASAAALDWLRQQVRVPVVGMEPAVKPASEATRNGRIGVLATPGTLEADRFRKLLMRYAKDVRVHAATAPGFVSLVEAGCLEGPEVEALVSDSLAPLVARKVDTLVLGCTHYPFLEPMLRRHLGPHVQIVDPGPAVARRALEVREAFYGPAPTSPSIREVTLFTSGQCHQVRQRAERLCPDLRFRCADSN